MNFLIKYDCIIGILPDSIIYNVMNFKYCLDFIDSNIVLYVQMFQNLGYK